MPFLRFLRQTGRSGFNSWPKPAAPLPQPLLRKAATNDLQIPAKIDCNTNDCCFVLFLVFKPEAIGRGRGSGERRGGGGYSREGAASEGCVSSDKGRRNDSRQQGAGSSQQTVQNQTNTR